MTPLEQTDPQIYRLIQQEQERQTNQLELIASENIASEAILEAQGSIFTNKYAEGYPNRRYYGGCDYADEVETLAINRAKDLFGAEYANVQPHSGSQASRVGNPLAHCAKSRNGGRVSARAPEDDRRPAA